MEKQYKSAYVLGKFMPFHNGHAYLIDTAITKSEKVTVIVGSLPTEPIPGKLRYQWVKEHYRTNPHVTVVHCDEVLPQYPHEHPDFWNIWVDVVKRYCPADIDVIFTSEEYGFEYAKQLGIQHHLVDIARSTYNISGTEVRTNPFAVWNFIPDHVKPYFVKKIAIMGSESCGKSTLVKRLAKTYFTNYVEEYGRTVYEENGGVTESDFLKIVRGQKLIESAMIKQSTKLLFCDTEALTTRIFFDMYYPNGDPGIKHLLDEYVDMSHYDLYILLKPDCPDIQDGTRNFLGERWNHYNNLKAEMLKREYNFIEVGGDWDNRYNESVKEIYKYFA